MKSILKIFLVCLLTLRLAYSQQPTLKVGDNAPTLEVYKWLKGQPIEEWNPNKIYLVEFGATWCTPCAAAIPKLSAAQKKYGDKISVVSLFVMESDADVIVNGVPKHVSRVESYIKKRADKIEYTVGVDDPAAALQNTWLTTIRTTGIPRVYVIDQKGLIRWIGTSTETAVSAIDSLLKNKPLTQINQPDGHPYDPTKLLLIRNNGGEETSFLFRSVLTLFDGKIVAGNPDYVRNMHLLKPDSIFDKLEDRLQIIGASLRELYLIAYTDTLSNSVPSRFNDVFRDTIKDPMFISTYGKYWHEPNLEVSDKSPFEFSWKSTRHRYNYSLKVPDGFGTAWYLRDAFRNDLQTYFGYDVSVEVRKMPYWSLSTISKSTVFAKLRSSDQSLPYSMDYDSGLITMKNAEPRDIIWMLGFAFGTGSLDYGKLPISEQAPFINETGITETIDFIFDRNKSFDETNEHLKKYGLELKKKYRNMKVIVIRDPK